MRFYQRGADPFNPIETAREAAEQRWVDEHPLLALKWEVVLTMKDGEEVASWHASEGEAHSFLNDAKRFSGRVRSGKVRYDPNSRHTTWGEGVRVF